MENDVTLIAHSLSSFGKFNAILFFKGFEKDFQIIYSDLVKAFNPIEIKKSFFDLNSQQMKVVDSVDPFNAKSSIIKVILVGGVEDLILEYFDSQFIIENLFYSADLQVSRGWSLIQKYLKAKDSTFVAGYELSLDIDSFNESLTDSINDVSCYPIFVIKSHSGRVDKECFLDENQISQKKESIILEYLEKLDIHQ